MWLMAAYVLLLLDLGPLWEVRRLFIFILHVDESFWLTKVLFSWELVYVRFAFWLIIALSLGVSVLSMVCFYDR